MLLQTNSYLVPKEKRAEHERIIRRIRQALLRIGCDCFEVYEQVGSNWAPIKGGARFIQIMRFHDRQHHHDIQEAEKNDPGFQQLINEFMELIDLPGQQSEGLFAMGYYSLTNATPAHEMGSGPQAPAAEAAAQAAPGDEAGLVRELPPDDHHDQAGGNSKPAQHEESEF
jgi:hypothetical protein